MLVRCPLCVCTSGTGVLGPGALLGTEQGRLPFLAPSRLLAMSRRPEGRGRGPSCSQESRGASARQLAGRFLGTRGTPELRGVGPFLLEPGVELLFLALTWWCLQGPQTSISCSGSRADLLPAADSL